MRSIISSVSEGKVWAGRIHGSVGSTGRSGMQSSPSRHQPIIADFINERPASAIRMPAKGMLLVGVAQDLEQEPGALFRLVDPVFEQAGCADIVMFVTNIMQ